MKEQLFAAGTKLLHIGGHEEWLLVKYLNDDECVIRPLNDAAKWGVDQLPQNSPYMKERKALGIPPTENEFTTYTFYLERFVKLKENT